MRISTHVFRLMLVLFWAIAPGIRLVYAVTLEQTDEVGQAQKMYERAQLLYDQSIYDSLPYYYSYAKKIFSNENMHDRVAACMLGMVDHLRLTGSPLDAERMMEETEQYILKNRNRQTEVWADARATKAKLYYRLDRLEESVSLLKEALELYKEINAAPVKIGRCHDALGSAHLVHGDLDRALENYQEALDILSGVSGGPSANLGNLMFNIGLVHAHKRNEDASAEYTRRAIENNMALYGNEYPELVPAYNSLASYYIRKALRDSAKACIDRAEKILRKGSNTTSIDRGRIYINRARIARMEGNYIMALEYYNQALSILDRQETDWKSMSYVIFINMANLYQAMGQFEEAGPYFEQLMQAEGKVHPTRMADYYLIMASNLLNRGRTEEAKEMMERVGRIRDQSLTKDNPQRVFEYLENARLMDSLGQGGRAAGYLELALSISRKAVGDHHIQTTNVLTALARHHLHKGDYWPALRSIQSALGSMFPGYTSASFIDHPPPAQSSAPFYYLEVLDLKLTALEQLIPARSDSVFHYWKAALHTGITSIQLVEMLRNTYPDEKSKLYISSHQRRLYERSLDAAWNCHTLSGEEAYLEGAFTIAEKAKYASLLSSLQQEDALEISMVPDSVLQQLEQLKMDLSINREALIDANNADSMPDRKRLGFFQDRIFEINDQLARLYEQLAAEYPGYYNLMFDHQVASKEEIRKMLRKGDRLIEYFISPEYLYVFSMDRRDLQCLRYSKAETALDHHIQIVSEYLGRDLLHENQVHSHESYFKAAYALNEVLIPSEPADRSLIIIPEGRLAYLPFDALVTSPVEDFDGLFDSAPFLLYRNSIRYAYSATLMRHNQSAPQRSRHRLVAFAPGYLDGEDQDNRPDPPRVEVDRNQLAPLPFSIQEVTEISNLLGGEAFTHGKASESRFKAIASESHIIHLATHTYLDDQDPLQSKIIFSAPSGKEDGLLNIYEIYNLELNAGMVVLSACNTGVGVIQGGEGIMSLARAFRYAGAPNILMSLWTVSDRNSYDLMSRFYRALSRGYTTERSIQKAKVEYLKEAAPEMKHPQYWAGFILAGNADRILMPLHVKIIIPVSVLLVIAGMGWRMIRWKRRKRIIIS